MKDFPYTIPCWDRGQLFTAYTDLEKRRELCLACTNARVAK